MQLPLYAGHLGSIVLIGLGHPISATTETISVVSRFIASLAMHCAAGPLAAKHFLFYTFLDIYFSAVHYISALTVTSPDFLLLTFVSWKDQLFITLQECLPD